VINEFIDWQQYDSTAGRTKFLCCVDLELSQVKDLHLIAVVALVTQTQTL